MASQANITACVCEKNPGGTCDCSNQVPCAFSAENKTLEWTCACKDGEGNPGCRCKFQIRCNREEQGEEGGSCCGGQTELFNCKCKCGKKECSIQIRKCQGCEVTRVDCECPADGGSCGTKAATAQRCEGCTCSEGGC